MRTVSVITLEGGTTDIRYSEIELMRERFSGRVYLPGDGGYDAARRVWNGMYDRRPALIASCAGEEDVATAVRLAATHGLLTALKGGAHSVAGYSAVEGGFLIDLSPMRGIDVDPDKQTAVVGAGATWGDLDRATQAFGLMAPGGEVSLTGVAGLTLGGGMGFARRAFGLSCDNLESVRIVTADGEAHTASPAEYGDLFWALQGGGGNFGVVTSFSFRLHTLGPDVFGLSVAYPLERAEQVLSFWRDFAESAPREVSLNCNIWSVPEGDAFPEELHGAPFIMIEGIYVGDPETGGRLLDPLRRITEPLWDESGRTTYLAAQSAFDEFLPDGKRYYWKSHFLNEMSNNAIRKIIDWAGRRINPGTLIVLRHLGGAVADVPENATAFGNRTAAYNVSIDNGWDDPDTDEANIAWSRECWTDLQDVSADGVYLNFNADDGARLLRAGAQANLRRLREIKARYDAANLFRLNANVEPAGGTRSAVAPAQPTNSRTDGTSSIRVHS